MQISLQDCGSIAVPDEMDGRLGVVAVSVLEAVSDRDDRFILARISPRVKDRELRLKPAFPIR